jgi:hypothetical protein
VPSMDGGAGVPVGLGVKGGNPRKTEGRLGGFGQILVTIEAYCNSNFRVSMGTICAVGGWVNDTQNAAMAAHRHAFAQGDLRGHAKGNFDFGPFAEGSIGEEEDSPRAKILSETATFEAIPALTEREWKKVGKPLPNTAFNLDWRGAHRSCPFCSRPSAAPTLAHRRG